MFYVLAFVAGLVSGVVLAYVYEAKALSLGKAIISRGINDEQSLISAFESIKL